jgi:hypothetical protein
VLGLTVVISACTLGTNDRDEYEKEMNAICRSAEDMLAAVSPPIDLDVPIEAQEKRVRRVNAQFDRISRQVEAELRAVEPPEDVSEGHGALLAAIDELKKTSARVNALAREAGKAYEVGDEHRAGETYARMGASLEAFRAAREKADRAASTLGLDDCRQQR